MALRNLVSLVRTKYLVSVTFACPAREYVVAKHKAVSYADALEWSACYPVDSVVVIHEVFLGRVASWPVGYRFQ